MKKLYTSVILCTLLIYACSDDGGETPGFSMPVETSTDSLFLVRQGPFNFSLLLPKTDLHSNLPMIVFKENSGELVVSLGSQFSFKVTQEIRSMNQIQEGLNESDVFKHNILESTERYVLAHRTLPDGTHVSYYYSQLIKGPKGIYYAETDPLSSFNLEQIRKLQKAMQSIHPI